MVETSIAGVVTTTRKPCLLDTDILIDYLRGHPSAKVLFSKLPENCAVSVLSVAELHAGVREGTERDALELLLNTFELIQLSPQIAARAHDVLQRWAAADLRSLNSQIEFLLRCAAQEAGRLEESTSENSPLP